MNFLLIVLCLLAGWLLRALNILPQDAHKGINAWILYLALPAVTLLYIPAINWSTELILPFLMPLLVWSGAWLAVKLYAQKFSVSKESQAALLLTAGLGNTSFVGFPLTQAYFGNEGLRVAVICDQMTFLVLATLGVVTAIHASTAGTSGRNTFIKNIIRFPPFVAFVAALCLPPFIDLHPLNPLLEMLAATLVPLALFSVGLQLQFTGWKREPGLLSFGLTYKLLVAPAVVLGVVLLFQAKGITPQASVFEAAMPPMVSSAILSSEYRLNPALANQMVSAGILLSLLTTAAWWFVVSTLL